jgi:hypothetical protein
MQIIKLYSVFLMLKIKNRWLFHIYKWSNALAIFSYLFKFQVLFIVNLDTESQPRDIPFDDQLCIWYTRNNHRNGCIHQFIGFFVLFCGTVIEQYFNYSWSQGLGASEKKKKKFFFVFFSFSDAPSPCVHDEVNFTNSRPTLY